MRAVLHSDVVTAARAVLAVPSLRRAMLCARLLREADWADRYTRRLGRPHAFWGNGTLMGAARGHPLAVEPTFDDPAYCSAFEMILGELAARQARPAL
jgi:hypothetical protein